MGDALSILDSLSKIGAFATWLFVGWCVVKKNGPLVLRRELEKEQEERARERTRAEAAERDLRETIPALAAARESVAHAGQKVLEVKEAMAGVKRG